MNNSQMHNSLIELFDLKGTDSKYQFMLTGTLQFARNIWKDPVFSDYTLHNLDHSLGLLKKALKVAREMSGPKYELSNLEKSILGCAALIHDIGMQYSKYYDDLSSEEVRDNHCKLGSKMVEDASKESEIGLPEFPIHNQCKSTLLDIVPLIAFSHASSEDFANKKWKEIEDLNFNAIVGGTDRRLKLVAALLRIGDELDMDLNRVREDNRLSSPDLNPISKAHWSACYYTQHVNIQTGGRWGGYGNLRTKLHWRSHPENVEEVRDLLTKLRIEPFNEEKEIIKPYLKFSEDDNAPDIHELKLSKNPELLDNIKPIAPEIREFLADQYPFRHGSAQLRETENLTQLQGDQFQEVKSQAEAFIDRKYSTGIIDEHYALKTGWHTKPYVRCRKLVADNDFARKLVKGLAEKFSNLGFTRIISIGTSSMRIGMLLAMKLETKFSYASGQTKIKTNNSLVKNHFQECKNTAIAKEDDKILILDDILGVGSVLIKLLSDLHNIGVPSENISAFFLFSFGHLKENIEKVPEVDIYYLAKDEDIDYWEELENGFCKVCKDQQEIRNRE